MKTGAKCTRLKVCLSACQFARVSLALFRLARSFPVFFVEDLPPFMMCARARQVSIGFNIAAVVVKTGAKCTRLKVLSVCVSICACASVARSLSPLPARALLELTFRETH